MEYRSKGIIQIAVSMLFLSLALWALTWAISSTDVTAGFCDSESFQMKERCNEPFIAFFLCIVSAVICYISLLFGTKNIKLSYRIK